MYKFRSFFVSLQTETQGQSEGTAKLYKIWES